MYPRGRGVKFERRYPPYRGQNCTPQNSQVIERLLIPAMMQAVLLGMQKVLGDDGGVLDPIKTLLTASMKEAVADISPDRIEKVMRRAKRVSTQALTALAGKVMGVQYLSIARLTAELADQEVIVVGAESPFAEAWDLMAEVIGLGWDKLEAQEAEAIEAAGEMRRLLASQGFYQSAS